MERGLLWLPLLGIFIWLYRQGRNEFEKVQGCENWSKQFERSKYDIYAVLAQKGSDLSWGKPTRKGIVDLQTFSLKDVESIYLIVNEERVSLETPPTKGKAALEFVRASNTVRVPFTEIPLAAEWGKASTRGVGKITSPVVGVGRNKDVVLRLKYCYHK